MDKEYMTNDTYRVMFKDYPDVVTVEQMLSLIHISKKRLTHGQPPSAATSQRACRI